MSRIDQSRARAHLHEILRLAEQATRRLDTDDETFPELPLIEYSVAQLVAITRWSQR
jgi:hypothetical protein